MLHKPASILTLKVPRQINKIYFLSIADGHRIFLLDHPFTEILFQVNGGTNDFLFFCKEAEPNTRRPSKPPATQLTI